VLLHGLRDVSRHHRQPQGSAMVLGVPDQLSAIWIRIS
jgi:hypothetical protein